MGEPMQHGGSGIRPADVTRRDALNASAAAALGVSVMVLPNSATASSVPVATSLVAPTGGVVYGWGTEFASGVFGTQSGSKSSPVEVTGTSFTWPEIVQVVTSRYNSFALTKDGDVYSLGSNSLNNGRKIGDPDVSTSTDVRTPVKAAIADVAQIGGGYKWVLVVTTSGQVWAWGGADAASGLATLTAEPTDVTTSLGLAALLAGGDTIVQVSSNFLHSIGLSASGRVFTWGSQTASNSPGLLGQSSTADLTSSTAVEIGVQSGGALVGKAGTEARIMQVSAGTLHSLALGRDGSVYAWGHNARNLSGSLGTGDLTDAGTPVNISEVGDLEGTVGTAARIVQVSAGAEWSLAVGLDGAVYAWGRASSGRLGNGDTTTNVTSPQRITGISGSGLPTLAQSGSRIVQVSAREENGYALGADARVYAWGRGGRVGDGTSTQRPLPVEITSSGVFAELSPNPGASRAPRRIVALATGDHEDAPQMLAIDDRG